MNDRAPTAAAPFDAREQADVVEFWKVYSTVRREVAEAALEHLADDPGLVEILQADAGPEQITRTHEFAERGVTQGDWEPYFSRLHALGETYAARGVPFGSWFALVSATRPLALPHLHEAYADDPDRLVSAVRGMGAYFDARLRTIGEAYLATREQRIARQGEAIAEISTPVLSIRPGLLLLPLVGVIDTQRSRQLTERLLRAIRADRGRVVVMDITGVVEVDTEVANRLIQAAEAARLMGATPIITGISPGVAQTLVALGIDLRGLTTVGDLQGGIERADAILAGGEDGVERSDA